MKWEIWGWSSVLNKQTSLAYCDTRKQAEELLRTWRQDGFMAYAKVRRRVD